jgi:hypothetical protein
MLSLLIPTLFTAALTMHTTPKPMSPLPSSSAQPAKMVGMYIHQHWPYKRPYCARTWTLADWRGYAGGLKKIGYNTILIWPMLETMPEPLLPSDEANLEKLRKVIDMLHNELGMRAYIVLCPNVAADNTEASKAPFEKRHFFYCDLRIDPGDPVAVEKLIRWREKLMKPLKNVDGVAIIDSDPGGYVGSTNQEFVNLLGAHRQMFDRVRPGIELIYWMHAGWEAYNNYYKTGKLILGSDAEHLDCLRRLKALNPEPWGVANGYAYAKELGIEEKVISFNYGRIEGEPSFPVTNFGGNFAYEGGGLPGPRGVMGNSQTHCVQLPNTFAFVRGAQGRPVAREDYVQFANDLIPGHGELIVRCWEALPGTDTARMRSLKDQAKAAAATNPEAGPLGGLLFGSPKRFLVDLEYMLAYVAAREDFAAASRQDRNVAQALRGYLEASEAWSKRHGYENAWDLRSAHAALAKLNHPAINACLARFSHEMTPADPDLNATPFERTHGNLAHMESFVPRLLKAMRQAVKDIK